MITLNLLPDEFRVKEKKQVKVPALRIIVGITGLVTLVTLVLYADFLLSSAKLRGLENQWREKQPQFQRLTVLKNEVEGQLAQEQNFMERFVTSNKPLTHLLMWVNESIPETSWLTNVTLIREENMGNLKIQGFVLPSPEMTGIEHIEAYMQQLKEVMPDAELSLTTSRKKFEGVSITQFIALFNWGASSS